jgi:hypothetical protein
VLKSGWVANLQARTRAGKKSARRRGYQLRAGCISSTDKIVGVSPRLFRDGRHVITLPYAT